MQGCSQRTILIIEDDPAWQSSLTSMFVRNGFNVLSTFDYNEALNQLLLTNPLPILAIVDLDLPTSAPQNGYDGIRVLAALREKGVYAIVLSRYIPNVTDSVAGQPEIRDLVDKLRFISDGFSEFFMAKVRDAVAYAEAARRAEGKMLDQQDRLRNLSSAPR